ncbi:MAG: MMPL family transporter [Pseudomonadota bacterium]|jgi:predicted RND superfamily exporter protein|nr:MMPL family transporter [Pseudomonadales bacterium]MEE3289743.1 MMPL family transporter [Pseudomonadota bacterium]GIT20794.1 MAG: membrane protein [Gammaproteobacteria bacterium]
MPSPAAELYSDIVFGKPALVISVLLLLVAFFAWHAQDFRLDASADSLLLENDPDLEFSREVNNRYGLGDSVIVAYTPDGDLFDRETLRRIEALREDLLEIDRVFGVDSILNVPVFGNTPLTAISEDYLTIMDEEQDLEMARQEIMESPVFSNALLSPDGTTAGLLVGFEIDEVSRGLLQRRTELRNIQSSREITPEQAQELIEVEAEYAEYSVVVADRQHEMISNIRAVLDNHRDGAQIYLGGAPMIADDLVTFVQGDLRTFSSVVVLLIVVALGLIFRKVRWVAMPLACCAVAGTIMVGVLGLMDWRVTVVSSNFISLLLIITISLTVHLMVRYRQLRATRHYSNHDKLLRHAVQSMFRPCLYTALTTAVAFGSLIVSGILPIITFGWMMMMGVATALIVAFTLFPAVMSTMQADTTQVSPNLRLNLTAALAALTDKLKGNVLIIYGLILVLSVLGLTRLRVENSFIDYFRESTEIYQGMVLFDEKLGGTLSFDVVVDLPEEETFDDGFGDFDNGFGDFDDGFGDSSDDDAYWFTAPKMDQVKAIHEYLDADHQTGKVLSFGAVIQLAEKLNANEPIDGLLWALLYSRIPEALKDTVLNPFVSIEDNQLRFNVRVIESADDLNRNELLQRIEAGVEEEFGLADEQVRLTGILVMYNNVLQSLFQSQILTLGVVMLAIMLMFLTLFRSLYIAMICIIPNAIAAALVLGIMGWLDIPLDIMTITIAAISVGIGVDNTIHYMHRFRREFPRFGNYRETMFFCHNSIGRAMYFTSMTIVAGFSILALSNFIPTIVFGLLTSFAMLVALAGSLTLLPQLLITFKPLGPETH